MVTRRTRIRLLLATALLHLLADVAFAGGAVLCVGSNGHMAIEAQHAVTVLCHPELPDEAAVPTTDLVRAESGECDDRPLHSEAEFVSKTNEDGNTGHAVAASTTSVSAATRPASSYLLGAHSDRISPHIRAHRSTVLII